MTKLYITSRNYDYWLILLCVLSLLPDRIIIPAGNNIVLTVLNIMLFQPVWCNIFLKLLSNDIDSLIASSESNS